MHNYSVKSLKQALRENIGLKRKRMTFLVGRQYEVHWEPSKVECEAVKDIWDEAEA